MTQFSDLFGADRDIVQETGATAGQKLRVKSTDGSVELESFDLAAETLVGVTTVTGDLKVTGLSAGSVISDADGNLSIGSGGGGVSGTAYRVPVFNSAGDGLEDSAVVTFSNLANVNTTSVRLNNANTGSDYNFFANTSPGGSGAIVMFAIGQTGGADAVGEVFLQFGGLGNTTIFGPFDVTVFKSAANDPDENFQRGPFGRDETFFLTNGLDFTGDFARAAIPFGHADLSTISSLLTTGADTTALSLGGNGSINLGFQNSKIVDVDTHNTYEVRAPLNISGDTVVTGETRAAGNLRVVGETTLDTGLDGVLLATAGVVSEAPITVGTGPATPISLTVSGNAWLYLNSDTTIDSPGNDFTVFPDGATVTLTQGATSIDRVVASTTNQSITFTAAASGFVTGNDLTLTATVATASTTVTGDLTATNYTGPINNINPVAGTAGIAQSFQIWAGTQSEFDTQFDNDGSGTVSGTPAASDGSVVYIITNN